MKQRFLRPVLVAVLGFCCPGRRPGQSDRSRAPSPGRPTAEDTREDLRPILQKYPPFVRRDPPARPEPDGARRLHGGVSGLVAFLSSIPKSPATSSSISTALAAWQNRRRLDPIRSARRAARRHGRSSWSSLRRRHHPGWCAPSSSIGAGSGVAGAGGRAHQADGAHDDQRGVARLCPESRRQAVPRVDAAQARDGMPAVAAPVGSIIWSMMAGIVLDGARRRLPLRRQLRQDEAHQAFMVVGVIILSLGIGFIFASLMAFVVSSRLGLFPQRPRPSHPPMRDITLTDMERLGAFDEAERTFQMTEEAFRTSTS